MVNLEICSRRKFGNDWNQEIRDARASRSDLKMPRTLPLPGKRVLVLKGLPGETRIDADLDRYR